MARRQQDIRAENQAAVLELLRQYPRLTRNQIANCAGLTVPTVSAILRTLQEQSLIRTSEQTATTGGRRAEVFCLNEGFKKALSIHVGVHALQIAIVDLAGRILSKQVIEQGYFGRDGRFVGRVREVMGSEIARCRKNNVELWGVGISFPGVVDTDNRITLAPNIGGEGMDLSSLMTDVTELPVYIDNDARLGALAEVWWRGTAPGATVAYVMADYGVGVGLAIDGKVHSGKNAAAGDIGHAVIDPRGRRCECGQFGCLETFVSFPALVRRISNEARLGRPTVLLPANVGEPRIETLNQIIDAALANDEVAREAVEEAGRYLAIAVSMLNVIVAPDVVYIGGTLSRGYELIISSMKPMLQQRGPELHRKGLEIEPASFRDDSSLMGAAALVYENRLRDNHLSIHSAS